MSEGKIQENPISRSSNVDDEPQWPGRIISDEERHGVSSTDIEPEPALGVGEHLTRGGEELARKHARAEGRKGAARRPHGGRSDESGLSEQRDETGTSMPGEPGDQGG
jgi:hypothetical protein